MVLAAQSAWILDRAQVHRLKAKHEPTHVNHGGVGAAMFRILLPRAAVVAYRGELSYTTPSVADVISE